MNIQGLNLNNKIRVSNPINVNQNKAVPSFSGQILTQDEHGEDVYKFNLPNAPKGTTIELAVMTPDKKGDYIFSQEVGTRTLPEGFNPLVVYASDLNLEKNQALGYRFFIGGDKSKLFTDNSVQSGGYNIATPLNRANPERPRQIEHILIDSFNVEHSKKTKRNHFNLQGGTLGSLIKKIDVLFESGVRNVLGTPIFGQDNKSSHGYWTTNPYQITDNLGSISDFNKMMVELYKRNMSWTADGAFVNEGIEGIHIKDMMNFGAESPFLQMFDTKDIGNEPFKFGVLSKNENVEKHTHIQLMNAPYKILFEKAEDGTYKEAKIVTNKNYVSSKHSYLQVFDDRLASESQMNGDKKFNVYAKKDTGDNHDIANYKDSVQAYTFRVDPKNVKENYEKYKNLKRKNKDLEFKNTLKDWPNFKIVESNKDGGVALWVGNSDIAKKRYVVFDSALNNKNLSKEMKDLIKAAQFQVQDDTVQVGKFWTGEASRKLTEYTAQELASKLSTMKGGDVSGNYKNAIESLIKEKKLAPQASLVLAKEGRNGSPLENILSLDFMGNRDYSLKTKKLPESVTDGLMSYPFDAIEFSPDLAGVMAYPYLKNLAVSEDTVGLSRFDMYKMGNSYYKKMPEKYRDLYSKMDKIFAEDMTKQANEIIASLQQKTGTTLIDTKGALTQEGKEVYSLVAPDVAKFLVVSALAPSVKPKSNDSMLEYDPKELQKIDLNSLNLQYEVSPEDVAKRLMSKIKAGVNTINPKDKEAFVSHLAKRLNHVDSDAVNVAKLIVEKTESGLDWRIDAAKDVADLDSEADSRVKQQDNIDLILKFWNKFNKGVREYNPKSYTIGELTDLTNQEISKSQFLQKTGFTTMSDYEWFYSTLPSAYGQNADGDNNKDIYSAFSTQFKNYSTSGFLEHLNFAHRFVGNQDKPRITHLLSMNVYKYNKHGNVAETKNIFVDAMNSSGEFNALSDDFKATLKNSLETISRGEYKKNGEWKEYDGENFATRPFDFVIKDIINQSKAENLNFKDYAERNSGNVKKLEADIEKQLIQFALEKKEAIDFAAVGLPGSPTVYAGDEFGLTGWETSSKNETQENRNALPWDRLNDNNYSFIKESYNRTAAIRNIRNNPAASALVNGASIELYPQQMKNDSNAFALYRYNDKTDAIVVLHNSKYGGIPQENGVDGYLDSIQLGGLPMGLPDGTIFVDAMDSSKRFKVIGGMKIEQIDNEGKRAGDIWLGKRGIILVREKDFQNREFPSFKGRMENSNVKLANMKYNFSYMSKYDR